MEPTFREESLREILVFVRTRIAECGAVAFWVRDPDAGRGLYAGELVDGWIHRPYRVWVDLAERLGLRMLTPRAAPESVRIAFERLDTRHGLRGARDAPASERYGAASSFARIDNLEEPGFVLDLAEAIERVRPPAGARILDLGVNTGGELRLLAELTDGARFVGVDHSASALAIARGVLPEDRLRLVEGDLNALGALGLGRFDLVVSLHTLQSPGIDDREVLRRIVQDHLEPGGGIMIGVPCARYYDGELVYGARVVNLTQPELGLVVKDLAYYRKYLQQHHRRVYVTGKYTLLVTAVAE